MQVKLLPHQLKFLMSRSKFCWLKGGLGSGKTFTLSHYIVMRLLDNPETLGLVAANSYTQLNNSILTELFRRLDELNLGYDYSTLTKVLQLKVNGAKCLIVSLEKYEQLRGIEFGWAAIDELAFTRPEAYDVVIGRLRCKKSKHLALRTTSTPNGFNFLYDRFASGGYISSTKTPVFKRDEWHELISASAYENFHLPADYLQSLRSQYSELFFKQEVLGEFVNVLQGRVYWAFDRTKHLSEGLRHPSQEAIAACDFNVNPMTGLVASKVGKSKIHVYSEAWLEYSNTYELARELKQIEPNCHQIVPDAAGSAKHSSATKSDHQILRESGFEVLTRRKNPPRKDRFNNTNRFFENGWLTIHPRCEKLITDLERCTHEEDDPMFGHISDALGYLCWNINPFKKPIAQPRVR